MYRTVRRPSLVGTAAAAAVIGLALSGAAACRSAKYPDGLYAEVATNKGLIVLKLDFERVPMTAANFVGLAEGTIANTAAAPGKPFFDATKWHRVVPGHVIQCGMGPGGAEGPGYEFPNEVVTGPGLDHGRAGVLGMANGGPHTNGSQWYITLGDRSYLDGDYTVFGEVAAGLDVVNAVAQGDDVLTVRVVRVGKAARAFRPTTASFQAMVEAAKAGVVKADAERRAREDEYVRTAWPGAVKDEAGFESVVLEEGRGEAPRPGAVVTATYTGTAPLHGKSFVSTADEGKPYWAGTPAAPFELTVGTPRVNPGFDAAVARMRKGEKRVVIVRPEQGYTANGFYAKQRPGEKRFVLSPNTLLVYEIEVLDIVPAKR